VEQTSPKYDVRAEKYPLPSTIDGIISLFRELMNEGNVQRIEFDTSAPVRVLRLVEADDPSLLEPSLDLDGVLRNVNMLEYISEDASSFQVLVDMMQLLNFEKKHCICWAVGSGEDLLSEWLEFERRGMPDEVMSLLNLPVRRLRSLPEDTLILCGAEYPGAYPEEITLAVKTAIEIRRPHDEANAQKRQSDDTVWHDPTKRPPAARELALTAGGLRKTRRHT